MAIDDPHRRFDDLFNLVTDPAFLLVAWCRVRDNKGARTAGVDGQTAHSVEVVQGVKDFLTRLRSALKDRSFRPLPVRERMIPKPGTAKRRRLGIPTVADRVVQASLKLVLEPIFEADFDPSSYGFRPNRRARDAVAEMRLLASNSYEWVAEADIAACFDEISHPALMDRVGRRVGDKRVLAVDKAFLKAGILTETGQLRDTETGTPQGGILSPLLANVALSALDEHFASKWTGRVERAKRRRHGLANYRLIRYADDFAIMVSGTKAHAEAVLDEVAEVLSGLGLRLAMDKTRVVHIDEGLDFLGWRIQRHRKRGTSKHYVYTYPARKALRSCIGEDQDDLLAGREPAARGPDSAAESAATGLDRLLPAGSVAPGLRVPARRGLAPAVRMAAAKTPQDQLEGTPPPVLPRRLVAHRRREEAVQPRRGADHPLPLPGRSDPLSLAERSMRQHTIATGLVGSPVLRNGHAGFGGRPEETNRSKDQYRASGRPYVVLVRGDRHHAGSLREDIARVLAPLELRLSPAKTRAVTWPPTTRTASRACLPHTAEWAASVIS